MAVEIATGYVSIVPSMKGFTSQLSADVNKSARMAGDEGGKSFKSGMMQHIRGIAVAFAGAFAVTKGIEFFKSSIKEASDLDESINAVNVTFGKSAKGIQRLSSDAATSMGLSKTEFNALAVRFSNFADTVAGKGGDVVGTMKDLTTRAADFASVMNLDVADAAELFQSGLAGETEPLRKYGIDLSAAKVAAYAYANGIAKTGTELTESQKVQARYALLMKSTAKTQGDFANTSDGLANKQRIMNAQWKNAKASIGDALLPVMEGLVGFIADKVVPAVQSFGDWFNNDGGPAIGRFGETLQNTVLPPLRSVVGWLVQNKEVILPIAGIIAGMVAAYKTWAFVSGLVTAAQTALNFALTANPIGIIVMAIAGLIAGLVLAYNKVGWFRDIVDAAWQWIKTATQAVWPVIQKIIQVVWTAIKTYVVTYIKIIKTVIETVWNAIKWATKTAWDLIKAFIVDPIKAAWQKISEVVGNLREWLSNTWATIKTRAGEAWSAIKDNIINPVKTAFEWVTDRVERGINRMRDLFGAGVTAIKEVWGGLTDALKKPINTAFTWVNEHVVQPLNDKVLSKFGDLRIPELPTFAQGGWVRGAGSGTSDSVLARLSNGEYVVSARAAASNAATLESINAGRNLSANVQSGGMPGPIAWIGGLFKRGAAKVITEFGETALAALRPIFGGSVGGQFAMGGVQTLVKSVAAWGDKQMAAPTALMEWMAKHFENMIGEWVGVSTCLQNVRMALEQAGRIFGFGVPLGSPAWMRRASYAANELSGVAQTSRPPRGAIGLWNYAPSGHTAVFDGKGTFLNNYGGGTVVSTSLAGHTNGYVGWVTPMQMAGRYDSGGYLPPGWSMAYNGTGRPEPVLTSEQWGRVGTTHNWHVEVKDAPVEDRLLAVWRRQEAMMGGV